MKRADWYVRIKENTIAAGTYRPYFDEVIRTLAGILERRDEAEEAFELSGESAIVEHTNVRGETNLAQNPALRLINDLNRDALAYWRDLGLTPAGLKKIDEGALKKRKGSALAEALRELNDG